MNRRQSRVAICFALATLAFSSNGFGQSKPAKKIRVGVPSVGMGNIITFPGAHGAPGNRRVPDRRSAPRGGRRASDKPGRAPLVLLVDADEDSNARCEAILARLHFAVAPTRNVEEAKKVMESLRPGLVIARIADAAALKQATATDVPIVRGSNADTP